MYKSKTDRHFESYEKAIAKVRLMARDIEGIRERYFGADGSPADEAIKAIEDLVDWMGNDRDECMDEAYSSHTMGLGGFEI